MGVKPDGKFPAQVGVLPAHGGEGDAGHEDKLWRVGGRGRRAKQQGKVQVLRRGRHPPMDHPSSIRSGRSVIRSIAISTASIACPKIPSTIPTPWRGIRW